MDHERFSATCGRGLKVQVVSSKPKTTTTQTKKSSRVAIVILGLGLFIMCLVFFWQVHPLIIFDTDDWCHLSLCRKAVPLFGVWNPTRVLPQELMPLCNSIAAWVLRPITNDYLDAITLMNALIAAIFITIYMLLFANMLLKRLHTCTAQAVMLTVLFFILHFLVFRVSDSGNSHMFYSFNVTSFYYYTLSNIWCASVVLYLMVDDILDGFFSKDRVVAKSIFLLFLYLALCSNLYASIMVASYVGMDLLFRVIEGIRKRMRIRDVIKNSLPKIFVLAFWGIVQVLEATGGRASSLGGAQTGLGASLADTVQNLASLQVNMIFIVVCLLCVLAFALTLFRSGRGGLKALRLPAIFIAAGALTVVYLVLVCAKAGTNYILRADVLFAAFFFVMVAVLICLTTTLREIPQITVFLPIFLLVVASFVNTGGTTFKNVWDIGVAENISQATKTAITRDIIEQIETAECSGESSLELHVPKFDSSDNWPFSLYAADYFSRAALEHGLVPSPVDVTLVVDEEMNAKYGIDVAGN